MKNFETKLRERFLSYTHIWNREERMLHLVEEVGEFAEIILQYNGGKRPKKDISDIKIALADILEDVFALSILYEIKISDLLKELRNEKSN